MPLSGEVVLAFMAAAGEVARLSKDETTKVGAALVGPDGRLSGLGYNGFPRGAPDDALPVGGSARHAWVIHAEENAILAAVSGEGFPLREGTMALVTHRPCARCLARLAHAGVRRAVYGRDELSAEQRSEAEIVEASLGLEISCLAGSV